MTVLHANYHTHTRFCDGQDTAEDMVQEALRRGFVTLGFSGHMDPGVTMDYAAYTAEIRRLRQTYRGQIELLRGVELDNVYDPGCVRGSAEYIIGSTHFVPVPGSPVWQQTVPYGTHREGSPAYDLIGVDGDVGRLHDQCRRYYNGDFYALSADYYRFEAMVAARLQPSFIGHFDLITRFNDLSREDGGQFLDETSERYLMPARKAIQQLVPYGLPFEINCGAINRGRKKEAYPRRELLQELQRLGGEILISADAHEKALLDGGFPEALDAARQAGFTYVKQLVRGAEEDTALLAPAKNTHGEQGMLYWQRVEIG